MSAQPAAQAESAHVASNQMLTFTLGEETYGVDILRVQEIRGWTPVTRIPQTPPHVLGVLNLRGSIVPIVDLRMRFMLQRAEYTPLTVIIVLSVESAAGRRDFGMVVDGVSDVIDVAGSDIKPTPDLGNQVSTEFIEGDAARHRQAHRRRDHEHRGRE
jgi:purine-binding chemotaxis protein CheW